METSGSLQIDLGTGCPEGIGEPGDNVGDREFEDEESEVELANSKGEPAGRVQDGEKHVNVSGRSFRHFGE